MIHQKKLPPGWANKFLQWYCRPELLEEIQGDAYELFERTRCFAFCNFNLLMVVTVAITIGSQMNRIVKENPAQTLRSE